MKQIISFQQRALRFKINRSVWNILPASGIAGTASVKILCQLLFADPELFSDFGRFLFLYLEPAEAMRPPELCKVYSSIPTMTLVALITA